MMIPIKKILPASPVQRTPAPPLALVRQPQYACSVCSDLGWVRRNIEDVNDPQFGKAVRCQCQYVADAQAARSHTYRWLGGQDRYARRLEARTFATFEPGANGVSVAKAYRQARALADKLRRQDEEESYNAVFLGPPGVGKTHLACAVLNAVREAGIPCLFASGNQLFQSLFDSGFDAQAGILRRAVETPVLCLDDLDKMHLREDGSYQRSTLFDLLNARDLAERPTIVTANRTGEWNFIHESMVSRLFGSAEIIKVDGEDFRFR